jgi:hypothetical protein
VDVDKQLAQLEAFMNSGKLSPSERKPGIPSKSFKDDLIYTAYDNIQKSI